MKKYILFLPILLITGNAIVAMEGPSSSAPVVQLSVEQQKVRDEAIERLNALSGFLNSLINTRVQAVSTEKQEEIILELNSIFDMQMKAGLQPHMQTLMTNGLSLAFLLGKKDLAAKFIGAGADSYFKDQSGRDVFDLVALRFSPNVLKGFPRLRPSAARWYELLGRPLSQQEVNHITTELPEKRSQY